MLLNYCLLVLLVGGIFIEAKNETKTKNIFPDTESDLPYDFIPTPSTIEKEFIKVASEKLLTFHPPLEISALASVECRRDFETFLRDLKHFEFYALKMHDSTGHFSSGILSGNTNPFGDYDGCLSAKSENFQGKFCLAYVQPFVPKSLKYFDFLRRQAQSHDHFVSNFEDPGHRIPRFQTFHIGYCIPSSCSSADLELTLRNYSTYFTNGTGLELKVKVEEEMCNIKDENWAQKLDFKTKVACVFFLLLLITIVFATIYDHSRDKQQQPNAYLLSFSLIKNSKELLSTTRSPSDITTAHAIRFYNAMMLVISHKCMALLFNPYANRTSGIENISRRYTVLFRVASIYTDPFLMISGMLTAYSLAGTLKRGARINVFKEYLSRYFRIMPSLAVLILFCTFILPLMGSGPLYNLVVNHHGILCRKNWPKSLLFIHNWFGFADMCMTHTHHVGIDTQLFWTAPFFVMLVYRMRRRGVEIVVALAAISTAMRYFVTIKYGLSNYITFQQSVQKLFETCDRMYILPPYRFTVYAIGLLLGIALREFKGSKISPVQLKTGWVFATIAGVWSILMAMPMGLIDYKFNVMDAAHYAGAAPIAYCAFTAWIIWTHEMGYKNKFTQLMEWKGFLIFSRISYGIYLTQFPIFFYNVGQTRTALQYSVYGTVIDFNEIFVILAASTLLTICVELPSNNLKKLLIDGNKIKQISPTIEPIPSTSKIHLDENQNIVEDSKNLYKND